MKKAISLLLLICMLLPSLALAKTEDEPIPDFCKPILESWSATNSKELAESIRLYWRENAADDWVQSLYTAKKRPSAFKLGGTTKELIASHKDWDIAIISSSEVDLQKLADEGIITHMSYEPSRTLCLNHWLLPEAVQDMFPAHPLYEYSVFCYSFDSLTDEAILLICNNKGRPFRSLEGWVLQILMRRSAELVRALEGVVRVNDWTQEGVCEWTEDDLLQKPDEWDWASLRIDVDDKLETLDRAGLLYDFSQDTYWTDRNPSWSETSGQLSTDGRIIAIPYPPIITGDYPPNTILVFIVNAKSPNLARSLEYAEHFIKSYEWIFRVIEADWLDPEIEKQYGEHSICIYKDQVNW